MLDVLDVEIELEDVHKQIRVRSARSWTAALGEGLNAGRSERLAHTQSAVSHWEAGRGKKNGVLPPPFPGGFGSDSRLLPAWHTRLQDIKRLIKPAAVWRDGSSHPITSPEPFPNPESGDATTFCHKNMIVRDYNWKEVMKRNNVKCC